MQTAGLPTFQQTFANCPFPEEVLAALGHYPVQVRVSKARRAMEVTAGGPAVPQEILTQAADVLKGMYGLHSATVSMAGLEPSEAVLPKAPQGGAADTAGDPQRAKTTAPDLTAQLEAMQKNSCGRTRPPLKRAKNA